MKKITKKHNKKNNETKKTKTYLIGLLLLVFLILVLDITFMSYSNPDSFVENHTTEYEDTIFFTYEVNRYPTSVEISNITDKNISIGFALDPNGIDFGMVPTGGNAGKRFITLENTKKDDAKIILEAYGNISSMVHFDDNEFYLITGNLKDIEIALETKNDTHIGNYEGEIDIVVKRSKYEFINWLL
ncbi:MAG: hypothetical protein KAS12_06410 [Candidatus Aenigmarchaeota archaeon]|nr:hypothetical protein [Candidatus Aenigmarchaeota archaeon]